MNSVVVNPSSVQVGAARPSGAEVDLSSFDEPGELVLVASCAEQLLEDAISFVGTGSALQGLVIDFRQSEKLAESGSYHLTLLAQRGTSTEGHADLEVTVSDERRCLALAAVKPSVKVTATGISLSIDFLNRCGHKLSVSSQVKWEGGDLEVTLPNFSMGTSGVPGVDFAIASGELRDAVKRGRLPDDFTLMLSAQNGPFGGQLELTGQDFSVRGGNWAAFRRKLTKNRKTIVSAIAVSVVLLGVAGVSAIIPEPLRAVIATTETVDTSEPPEPTPTPPDTPTPTPPDTTETSATEPPPKLEITDATVDDKRINRAIGQKLIVQVEFKGDTHLPVETFSARADLGGVDGGPSCAGLDSELDAFEITSTAADEPLDTFDGVSATLDFGPIACTGDFDLRISVSGVSAESSAPKGVDRILAYVPLESGSTASGTIEPVATEAPPKLEITDAIFVGPATYWTSNPKLIVQVEFKGDTRQPVETFSARADLGGVGEGPSCAGLDSAFDAFVITSPVVDEPLDTSGGVSATLDFGPIACAGAFNLQISVSGDPAESSAPFEVGQIRAFDLG